MIEFINDIWGSPQILAKEVGKKMLAMIFWIILAIIICIPIAQFAAETIEMHNTPLLTNCQMVDGNQLCEGN